MTPEAVVDAGWREALRQASRRTVTQWADRYRMLAGRASAEAGRYRSARTPYIRAVLNALSEGSPITRVVVMKAARLGFTEAACNWLGYVIHESPAPFLFVETTLQLALRLSRQSIDALIAETPELRARVPPSRSGLASNTLGLQCRRCNRLVSSSKQHPERAA